MELNETADGPSGIARVLPAVALMGVSVRSIWNRKRLVAVLAGVGAIALGYIARGDSDRSTPDVATEKSSIETTSERGVLRCAVCGEPIVVGEGRGPNEDHEIVHDACEV